MSTLCKRGVFCISLFSLNIVSIEKRRSEDSSSSSLQLDNATKLQCHMFVCCKSFGVLQIRISKKFVTNFKHHFLKNNKLEEAQKQALQSSQVASFTIRA